MTALQLIYAIKSCGGRLTLKGDKIRCVLPEEYADLITAIRSERDAIFGLLQQWQGSRLPWAGYNGGLQFACGKCGAHFDTSVGFAKHFAFGCDYKDSPATAKTLPSCPACGSFYLYPEKDGRLICMACQQGTP